MEAHKTVNSQSNPTQKKKLQICLDTQLKIMIYDQNGKNNFHAQRRHLYHGNITVDPETDFN